ncbi:MAG: LPS-assembly protein LptD [candidate division NC10 bacterium]|nr:LPS-assembly protein LptD [candidate division NC10 bacterium]
MRRLRFWLALLVNLFSPLLVTAQELPVQIEADQLEYRRQEGLIIGRGAVVVRQEEAMLAADEIIFDIEREEVMAYGNVRLQEGSRSLEGEQLLFDTRLKRGVIMRGKGFIPPALSFTSAEIRREDERRYRLIDAAITTCRVCQPEPGPVDWELKAKEITVIQDEMVYLKGASFWIREIPTLYTPYFAFTIGPRRTGFLTPQVGYGKKSGFVYSQPFFWAISESQDATFTLTARSSRGVEVEAEYRYVFSTDARGEAHVNYLNDRDPVDGQENRVKVKFDHDQRFTPTSRLKADINYVNDVTLSRQFVDTPTEERTSRVLDSRIFFTKGWPHYTLTALAEVTRDLATEADTRLARLPDVRLSALPQPLLETPLNLDGSTSVVFFDRPDGIDVARFDFHPGLSYPLFLTPFLLTSKLALRETTYTKRGDGGEGGATRELVEVTETLETRLGRSFQLGALFAITHLIEPMISFQFVPEVHQRDLPQIDFDDFVSPQSRFSFGLTNRLVTHYKAEDDSLSSRELLRFQLRQSYNPAAKERIFPDLFLNALTPERIDQAVKDVQPLGGGFSSAKEREFSNLVADLLISPFPFLQIQEVLSYNVQENQHEGTNLNVRLSEANRGFFEVSYSFVKGRNAEALIGKAGVNLTPALLLEGTTRVDFVQDVVLETGITARYRTCCWELGLRFTNRHSTLERPSENDVRVLLELKP